MSFDQDYQFGPTRTFDLSAVQFSDFSKIQYFHQEDSDDEAAKEQGKSKGPSVHCRTSTDCAC